MRATLQQAEVKGTAVGLMSLTADLDVRILQKCFELHAYDNLLRVDSEAAAARVDEIEVTRRDVSDESRSISTSIMQQSQTVVIIICFLIAHKK